MNHRYIAIVASLFTGLLISGLPGLAPAGLLDSVERSANRTGNKVEQKTGHRSDGSKYKKYMLKSSKIRVQLPVSLSNHSKKRFWIYSSKQERGSYT